MRWHLLWIPMLAACDLGFSTDDAMRVSDVLRSGLGCPRKAEYALCPDGGELDRRHGPLNIEGCAVSGLVLEGAGLEVNVECGTSSGALDIAGAFATNDGTKCTLDFHVRSKISNCRGPDGSPPCETSWSTTGDICGHDVAEVCTDGGGGFLSSVDCN